MKECFFRPLSVFLATAMLIGIVQTGALPVYALEEGGTNSATQTENSVFKFMKATTDDTSGKCGENLTYDFDSSTGTLTISGTGDMYDYFDDAPWVNLNVVTVRIESGVTNIGRGAFQNCKKLTNVTIPDSIITIGDYTFYGCENLTNVTVPNSVTTIGRWAFCLCASLTSVTIPNSVTTIGDSAFIQCENLTNVTIPNSVTSIEDSVFKGCKKLTGITIPDSVTSIGEEVFSNCTKLKNINVDDGNKDFISSDGVLFDRDQTKLLAFPGGKKANYTIPDSVNEVAAYAFSGCQGLTSVFIPSSVTSIGEHVFALSTTLTNIDVAQDNTDYTSMDGVLFNKTKTELLSYPAGKGVLGNKKYTLPDSVTSIGDNAFSGCYGLTSVTIPNSVTSIGQFAFWSCASFTNVTIPRSVTNIGFRAFGWCENLTSINIPDSVISIGFYAFAGCENLTSIIIPSSVSSIVEGMFSECTSLTSVTIPDTVTNIDGYVFDKCAKLADVYYGGNQTQWDTVSIGESNDPLANATIHYNSNGSDPQPTTKYTVTVNSGTAAPEQAAKNVTVSIKADVAPNGQIFDQWESEDGVTFANANSASTTFKMPEKNVTVTATYKDLPDGTYTVTVVNGGVEVTNGIVTTTSAAVGMTVKIKADPAPSGKTFDKWTSADGITFAGTTKAETTFEMPEKNVIVTANYKSTGGSSGGGSKGGGSKGGSSGSGKAPTQQPSSSTTTSTTVINGGTQVNISAPVGTANIPADLNAIMSARASGQNLNFTVNNSQTGQPAYTWSFNGAQLAQATQIGSLNLAITVVPTASVPEVQSAVAGNAGITLRFANNGQLPAPATITVNVKDQGYQPGQVLYFYYLNPTTGKLEIQNNGQPITVGEQGYAAVIVTHNSDFVLLPAKISSAGSLALDTISYTMQKGKSYEIGAKLVGEGATLKVTSSRNGIAKIEQTKSGNYKVTALKDGITYVSFDVVVGGKVVSHSSVKITVQNGKAQGVSTQRVLNF